MRAGDDGPTDPNRDLRNEIGRDLRTLRRTVGAYDGLVISGDIAFSGQRAEYEVATKWLQSLCEAIECDTTTVMITPGNHDVDREEVLKNAALQQMHASLRQCDRGAIDSTLKQMIDGGDGHHFFAPLVEYNAFASQFGCAVSPESPFWERDFELPYGTVLRLRGMTSVCVSNPEDDEDQNRLVLGAHQTELSWTDEIEYVALAHHPPSWLRDQDEVERRLNNRARLQLFGHRHDQVILRIRDGVRLIAGATHPDPRKPQWEPRYSVITFRVRETDESLSLEIVVHPRRWHKEFLQFAPDADPEGSLVRTFQLPIERAVPSDTAGAERVASEAEARDARMLRYQFLRLGRELQEKIATQTGLCTVQEFTDASAGFADELIARAKGSGQLGHLFERVAVSHGNKDWLENPFDEPSGETE